MPELHEARAELYRKIETMRRSRVLCYVTGDRPGMEAQISPEVSDFFATHLDGLFPTRDKLSLILHSNGGPTLAGWNLVNMLRMFCDELEIIVPAKAWSTATLMCLGADRIVMTKQATLGPIDPSLRGQLTPQIPGHSPMARAEVSVEAVRGYIELVKRNFGIRSSADMATVLVDLAGRVHPLVLGEIFRSRAQIQHLAARLLKHTIPSAAKQKKIVDFLCSDSGSHDYTINRLEAEQLGLKVEKCPPNLYEVLRALYRNISAELELSVPFNPAAILGAAASAAYSCRRSLIESTGAKGHVFVTEGEISRTPPAPGVAASLTDHRTFEGWRQR